LLLPQGVECRPCVRRLEERVRAYRGIEMAHLDTDGDKPRFCVHYDPNLVTVEYVRAIAVEEGAHLSWRYRHETLPVRGLDCADCAQTLETGLERLDGVLWVAVNFAAASLAIEYDSQQIGRPAIVGRIQDLGYELGPPPAAPQELVFQVGGMDCADCAVHLEEALRNSAGIAEAKVDFSLARLRLTPAQGAEVRSTAEQVAAGLGYSLQAEDEPQPQGDESGPGWHQRLWRRRRDLVTLVSGLLIAMAVGLTLLGVPEKVVAGLYVAAIVIGGYYIARSGWMALRMAHSLDMNALMTIAAVGAVVIGEWAEGAVVVFLFSVGNALEGYTMDRARKAIRGLMNLAPPRATVLRGEREERVPVEELRIGDRILILPGERIPMDGLVLSGDSAVNQAPITGESVPVDKGVGDKVFAGTVNGQGVLTVRVDRLAADTTIARIIKMVEEAQAQKAPAQRFVDRFARVYTPVVVTIAVAVAFVPPLVGWLLGAGTFGALFGDWLYRALVLLVIACPCALVISTPVSIVSAIANAARAGVLIKGGAHLEMLGSLKVIAFDKTGTLTIGRPQVVEVRCLAHADSRPWTECPDCRQVLALTAAVERRSEHPLALAVVQEAEKMGLTAGLTAAEAVTALTGQGVRGVVDGRQVTVGRHSYIHGSAPDLCHAALCAAVDAAQAEGQTVMVVRDDGRSVLGYIAVADQVRPGVEGVMHDLRQVGIEHTVMLTGDNEATARAIAAVAGVDEVEADLLPEDKVAAINRLLDRYEAVAMVGDGVNDAPALAQASVGIAMGAAGTDTALETADVALMADDLSRLAFAVQLSRRTRAIIRQNVVIALGIKAAFLALAVAGIATLWMAVFADVGASLIVILNSMRLLRER